MKCNWNPLNCFEYRTREPTYAILHYSIFQTIICFTTNTTDGDGFRGDSSGSCGGISLVLVVAVKEEVVVVVVVVVEDCINDL
jgi:hypothetical protein